MSRNFETDFSTNAVQSIADNAHLFHRYADVIGVSPLGVAGSIMREITAADNVYEVEGSSLIWHLADGFRAYIILRLLNDHEDFERDYLSGLRSNSIPWRGP